MEQKLLFPRFSPLSTHNFLASSYLFYITNMSNICTPSVWSCDHRYLYFPLILSYIWILCNVQWLHRAAVLKPILRRFSNSPKRRLGSSRTPAHAWSDATSSLKLNANEEPEQEGNREGESRTRAARGMDKGGKMEAACLWCAYGAPEVKGRPEVKGGPFEKRCCRGVPLPLCLQPQQTPGSPWVVEPVPSGPWQQHRT